MSEIQPKPKVQIKQRFSQQVLFETEADTVKDAVVKAVADRAYLGGANLRGAYLDGANLDGAYLRGAYLGGANLRGAYLRGANLGGANLRGAYLDGANLDGANLRGAYLDGANLDGANLRGAYLDGANLDGANLRGANLDGAKSIWGSHDIIAEILRRAAGDDVEKRKIAGLILVSRDWCVANFVELKSDPLFDWAVAALAPWVQDGDNAPAILRAAHAKIPKNGDASTLTPVAAGKESD